MFVGSELNFDTAWSLSCGTEHTYLQLISLMHETTFWNALVSEAGNWQFSHATRILQNRCLSEDCDCGPVHHMVPQCQQQWGNIQHARIAQSLLQFYFCCLLPCVPWFYLKKSLHSAILFIYDISMIFLCLNSVQSFLLF